MTDKILPEKTRVSTPYDNLMTKPLPDLLYCIIIRPMLLIFPPVARPCEPPAGIGLLAGFLKANGVGCRLLDANLEGMLWLLGKTAPANDTWTRRAGLNCGRHLDAVRHPSIYSSPDRYRRAVSDLNRLLNVSGKELGITAGLADFKDSELSPVRSADLLRSAENFERNIFYPWFRDRLPAALEDVSTVGISLNYLSQALASFAMIGFLRQQFPEKRIILGGGLVTSWISRPDWVDPFGGLVDELVAGPGESTLLSLSGRADRVASCSMPDYSELPLEMYISPGLILPYSASSGCYWNNCSFCPEPAEGNRYIALPPKRAISDLGILAAEYRPSLIHILDNAISPALLGELQKSPPAPPWYGFVRFNPELADPDYCIALKKSGCVMLKLGLESGDQGVLDRMHKGIDLDMASKILANLKIAGIGVYLYLLFGTPAETEQGARRTLEFVVRHRDAIGFLNLAIFNMPICCDDAREFATNPFYQGDLSLYTDFRHPDGWGRGKVRNFLEKEFKREPSIAAIIRRDPPIFTSNHAPFFC